MQDTDTKNLPADAIIRQDDDAYHPHSALPGFVPDLKDLDLVWPPKNLYSRTFGVQQSSHDNAAYSVRPIRVNNSVNSDVYSLPLLSFHRRVIYCDYCTSRGLSRENKPQPEQPLK